MAGEQCFTLVCLRRLEEDPAPAGSSVEDVAVSHDRRLLAVRDSRGLCRCHSCDNAKPAFALPPCLPHEVEQNVWVQLPAEKNVRLHKNMLSEYPGSPCLVALERRNAALVLCLFCPIEGPDIAVTDRQAQLAENAISLEQGAPLLRWTAGELPESLPPNQVWRYRLPLAPILGLFPDIVDLVAGQAPSETGDAAGAAGDASCSHLRLRLCVAQPSSLVLFIDDVVAMIFGFGWRGITTKSCFFLQRPRLPSDPHCPAPVTFSDIVACQDWIFAVTPPPSVYLLMWNICGVAFHAVPLGEYLPEGVHFVSLVVALDLLGVSLCDNRHNVWIMSLDRYFDNWSKGLDWEMVKERLRCARDVGVLGQTSKDYQELSMFPEAFGLQAPADPSAPGGARRKSVNSSVMDCLVEGVPTYGIPLPNGAFGVTDEFFGSDGMASEVKPGEAETAGVGAAVGADMSVSRCIPFAWHERVYQSQEWLDVDRPWAIPRGERQADPNVTLERQGGRDCAAPLQPSQQLNGFSIPAQHRLGDDDLHYSLYAALHKHARRQFQSRLPPWLTKTHIRQRPLRLMPPVLGRLDSEVGRRGGDDGSDSELAGGSDSSDAGGVRTDGSSGPSPSGRSPHGAPSQQDLVYGAVGPSHESLRRRRRKARIGRVRLSMTASQVFCEIWEEAAPGAVAPDCPWGLCVIPRPSAVHNSAAPPSRQVDHLTGSLLEAFNETSQAACSSQQQGIVFRSRGRWRSLLTQNHIWYMLAEGGSLYALLLSQSPVRIISNLLIFESRAKASRLCALNGWNPKQLPVLTLFLGLRFRQLEEIRQSLGVLKPDQEMEACQMIMDFIAAGYSCATLVLPFSPSPSAPLALADGMVMPKPRSVVPDGGSPPPQPPADRSFVSRLLEIAMQYVTKLIQTRVAQIQDREGACRAITYLQPVHAAREPPRFAAMVNELSQLTVHMQTLRALQQQLIKALGDEKAYDSGIHISCPAQSDAVEQAKVGGLKTGLKSLDDAVALAAKLQSAGGSAASDRAAQMAAMRGAENAEAIVRGALISGRISSALNWFHELAAEESGGSGAEGRVFEEFRVTAGRLAYQLVCNQQLDFVFVAMHMLRNVGESINRFFKAVAFHTSKRLVRRRLLRHVDHMNRLTPDEQSLICLVNVLEQLYTNPCYTTEFNRMTTRLTTGQYPQRAHSADMPPFYSWPAGGRSMFLVGIRCDGAVGGHLNVDAQQESASYFEQQTSLRELPMAQRMPLELYDMWAGYQTPVMAAMLEMPPEARRAWGNLPCGDIDDLDAKPILGLSNFHQGSNVEKDQDISIADLRDVEAGGEGDGDTASAAPGTGTWTTCRRCQADAPKDELDGEMPKGATSELAMALGIGEGKPQICTMGYLHVTLGWMRCWSWRTRVRIVMEKTHFRPALVEALPWLRPPASEGPEHQAWSRCWLDFLVAHQDWRGLAAWVRSLPLRLSDRADDHGRSCVDLTHLEERGLPYCTSYAKEIMLQELGRRGVFCRSDVQSFPTLLRRLAQCGRLFGGGPKEEHGGHVGGPRAGEDDLLPDEGALPLDRLLPIRGVCPFHRFFIHWCVERDLPTVMVLYLQRYELGTTMEDLKALNLRHAEKPWASLLLVGRLGNAHLFAASLQHAAAVYGGKGLAEKDGDASDLWHDVERAALMPLNGIARRSPTAFLATLMFAPVASALDAVAAPSSVPWSVDLDLFKRVIQDHPALHEAFFPADAPPMESNDQEGRGGGASETQLSLSLVASVASANRERWLAGRAEEEGRSGVAASEPAADVAHAGGSAAGDAFRAAATAQGNLDDMTTFKEDTSLAELLGDVASFDVHSALRPLPIFRMDVEGADVAGEAASSLADLVAQEERFRDELEEGYFLAQGRAMMAFHVLMTKCALEMEQPGELKFPLVLSSADAKRLHKIAKSIAFHNLLNEGVVSSAVCLLELCSLETEMLRVDVQAARRIYEHHLQQGQFAGREEGDRARAAAASVIELFLSFPDVQDTPSRAAEAAINSGHLLTALRMLEESTWALDPHPSAPSVSSLQALAYDSPWHLVALFCRVHSLPRSLTLLHELARNNDWVMFLHESDLQQCPADTVLDVVDGYFTDMPLRSHLRILAHSIAAQEQDPSLQCAAQLSLSKVKSEPEVRQVGDAIGFLERCREKVGVSKTYGTGCGLLQQALLKRTARLAVVASAFKDVSALQCMAAWLSVNTERFHSGVSSDVSPPTAVNVPPTQPSPAEVANQIASLCRKSHAFSLVLRALKIFDPNNPLVEFVKFHRAFVQCRLNSCREHLRKFVQRRNAESQEPAAKKELYCLELVPYVTQLSEEMVQYLLDGFPRARMMLLSALDQADFSPHYSHLFRSFQLIQQTGLDVDFRMPAGELLQLLISRKMFAEAREWASSSGIVSDTIVFEEVTGMIVEFRQGVWWNVLDERLHLWHKCYDAFLQQGYPAVGAALFFLDITSKLEPDLFAREQLMLLCIAFELLGASPEGGGDGGAQAPAAEARPRQPQALGREQLERIRLSMLLILTGTNKELAAELGFSPLDLSYGTLRALVHRIPEGVAALPLYHNGEGGGDSAAASGTLPKWDAGGGGGAAAAALVPEQRGPRSELLPYLETAISSLINCDEIVWARRLAQGFDFDSADLTLAGVLETIASGQAPEPLGDFLDAAGLLSTDTATVEAVEAGDVERLLQTISTQCSPRISMFCRRRVVCASVARSIGMDYSEVCHIDVGLLLDRLLSPQPKAPHVALCRSLLSCYPRPLNKAALAEVLANRFVLSTVGPGTREWSEEELGEFVSLLGASQDKLGDAALRRIPNFQRGAVAAQEGAEGMDAAGQHGELPLECEVKVIIMAYHAYVQACSESSIGELLRNLEHRVRLYVQLGGFELLVRLLAAIPEYHAMEYMFGYLVHHGRLELLLELARRSHGGGGNGGGGQAEISAACPKPALAIALVRYLQQHLPGNLELLVQVHLCFGMESQLASLLERKAWKVAHSLGRKWENICSEQGEEQLLMCLSLFLQASRFFLRGKRYQTHLRANEFAALICLQLKAVQIHLAASLQEQQNAVPRPEALKDDHLLGIPELEGLSPHLLSINPNSALGRGALAKLEGELDAAMRVDEPPGGQEEELPLGGAAPGAQTPPPLSASPGGPSPAPAGDVAGVGGAVSPADGHAASGAGLAEDLGGVASRSARLEAPGGTASPAAGAPPAHGLALGPAGDPFVVINLETVEVEVFAEYHQDFIVAFQVVSAYRHTNDLCLFRVWPRALYRQVVLHGNYVYLWHFMQHLPIAKESLDAVVRLYNNEACPEQYPQRARGMTFFLREGVTNLELQYQLARQLGAEFADVQNESASLVYMA